MGSGLPVIGGRLFGLEDSNAEAIGDMERLPTADADTDDDSRCLRC